MDRHIVQPDGGGVEGRMDCGIWTGKHDTAEEIGCPEECVRVSRQSSHTHTFSDDVSFKLIN